MLFRRKLKKRFLHKEKFRNTNACFDIGSKNLKRVMEEKDMNISNCETGNEDQDLKKDETPFKAVAAEIKVKEKVCVKNSIRPVAQDSDSEFPAIEVIKIEDDEDEIQEIMTSNEPEMCDKSYSLGKNSSNQSSNLNCSYIKRRVQKNSPRRVIFPDPVRFSNLYEQQSFQCYMVEHTYCKLKRYPHEENEKTSSSGSNKESATTLTFENSLECDKNRTEQQTIDASNSITKHFDFESNSSNNDSIKDGLRKRPVDAKVDSNEIGASSSIGENSNTKSLKNQSAKTTGRLSNGKRGFIKIGREDFPPGTASSLTDKRESNVEINFIKSSEFKKLVPNFSEKSFSPNKALSLDDIAKEISEMERLLQSKCEVLSDKRERHNNDNNDLKAIEVLPSKMRKLSTAEEVSDLQKDGEYVLSMHKLTKVAPEKKNWNLEYTEDDVKNLGIDDLLLRASELNAENFTKALGQNSGGRTGNKGDGSDIVLTFPGSRRDSDEALVGESTKGGNSKKTKIGFLKKCIKDDKISKIPPDEEPEKKVPEVSPKRPGIKVKTVQNINEEFKDSLGAKLKNFDSRNMVPDSTKPLYAIADELPKKNLVQDGKDQIMSSATSVLTGRKVHKAQDQGTGPEEVAEESRPFVMTIIQNKDSVVKDHVSTVSAPKVFVKSKPICPESGNAQAKLEEQIGEASSTNKKSDVGDSRTATENVTLVVSEPKTSKEFEVVNVDEYIPDGSAKSNPHFVVNYGCFSKKKDVERNILMRGNSPKSSRKKIPIILNSSKKCLSMRPSNNHKMMITQVEDSDKGIKTLSRQLNRLNTYPMEKAANAQGEKPMLSEKATFTVTSMEQKTLSRDASGCGGIGKMIRLPSNETNPKNAKPTEAILRSEEQSNSDAENEQVSQSKQSVMTLAAFSNILKDILPDKWVLSLDKRYGLQIIKIHLDELLNPSIMISVVVGRTGKVTVNVRGRQLEKSHDLFSNLCDIANSNEKISINYILAIINKLRFFNVCFGCDDLSLKKYWCEDGFIEYYTEFQQTYRSHICESLVRSGRKRCYPCYRMHESLKKRKRREQLLKKTDPDSSSKSFDSVKNGNENESLQNHNHQAKGVKRNLEEFLEESFLNMKQKIADEIEKTKEDEENEKVPKTQDEVLSFMGLTRKDSLDINLRKSKREKKGFKKCESIIGNSVNKEELYFLEKYWPEINVLFSTSLLIGAYSRTSTGRLREKCRMFHKLLSTWQGIIRDNPDWVGGHINLTEGLVCESEPVNAESVREKFDNMDIPALRAYIINCVKEVNKIKSRLRTKNNYFKVLYNTFVKPRMKKKAKQNSEPSEMSPIVGPTPLDSSPLKDSTKEVGKSEKIEKIEESTKLSTSTELESSDENSQLGSGAGACVSDGD